ncbi:response regulator [Stieleria sp. TO1_6]|uniref:HD domain-containing phosphohydrolase n=1 Tax=Stieleria tagensis TaxID=2956795 RepID=UPI00209A7A1B|nr:HD domain-containing phosphohydrolase [Stieleria tagensis]MCO8121374.1 response regulator [Stieleria tagensis]
MTVTSTSYSAITPAPVVPLASLTKDTLSTKSGRVMVVDDEPINIKLIQKYLRTAGYRDFVTTSDSREAVGLVQSAKPDILILDVLMPHVTGLNILETIRSDSRLTHIPVLIVTASTDEQTKIDALELGATDFLYKPVKPTELLPRVRNSLVLKAHHDQMAAYSKRLECEVAQRTADLAQSREEVIHVLACAAEHRDQETGNHVIRVGRFTGIIARELGYSEAEADLLEHSAILHDAGKIAIADSILLKPEKLTEEEFETMKRHCEYGERILKAQPSDESQPFLLHCQPPVTRSPVLRTAAAIAKTHHERWDGKGYPDGLVGDQIPIEGRITAVADVFDALSSKRCYKDALPLEQCVGIMLEQRGKHFDPRVLDAFLARIDEVAEVVISLSDA